MGFGPDDKLWFIQIKTEKFPPTNPMNLFCRQHPKLNVKAKRKAIEKHLETPI